ncbi:hypothetical protein BDV93DRAFT_553510 [Ceratobasidium sp. AG-I]|nr:hypothetical protein BDV93DRAFT_553510 [Ceratobasidium sp. AG-I]
MGLLFRRVSPAETKSYALIRNIFAVFSMAAIVWRAVTAFSQAQNEFETRMAFHICPEKRPPQSFYVMVSTPIQASTSSNTFNTTDIKARPNVTMSGAWSAAQEGMPQNTYSKPSAYPVWPYYLVLCRFLNGPTTPVKGVEIWFTMFDCRLYSEIGIGITRFNIYVHSSYRPSERSQVWLSSNMGPFDQPPAFQESPSLHFNSAMRLEPGFHLDAEAGFITRRLISSSVLHDVILQRQTTYKEVPVYPLSEYV